MGTSVRKKFTLGYIIKLLIILIFLNPKVGQSTSCSFETGVHVGWPEKVISVQGELLLEIDNIPWEKISKYKFSLEEDSFWSIFSRSKKLEIIEHLDSNFDYFQLHLRSLDQLDIGKVYKLIVQNEQGVVDNNIFLYNSPGWNFKFKGYSWKVVDSKMEPTKFNFPEKLKCEVVYVDDNTLGASTALNYKDDILIRITSIRGDGKKQHIFKYKPANYYQNVMSKKPREIILGKGPCDVRGLTFERGHKYKLKVEIPNVKQVRLTGYSQLDCSK